MKHCLLAIVSATLLYITPLAGAAERPSVATIQKSIETSEFWIDVRTPQEYDEGHLSHSINIPLNKITSGIDKIIPDKNTPIHLYCRSGNRSELAMKELLKLGYTNVHNEGSYQNLLKQGLK